jgi:putative flippase GtrA
MIIANYIHKIPQPLRFVMVGGLAASVHFMVVLMLVEYFQTAPLAANGLAFCIAFCVSFTGQKRFTFTGSNKSAQQSFFPYLLISITSFVCNELLLGIGIYVFKFPYQITLFCVLIIVALGTYFSSKYWAFAKI